MANNIAQLGNKLETLMDAIIKGPQYGVPGYCYQARQVCSAPGWCDQACARYTRRNLGTEERTRVAAAEAAYEAVLALRASVEKDYYAALAAAGLDQF